MKLAAGISVCIQTSSACPNFMTAAFTAVYSGYRQHVGLGRAPDKSKETTDREFFWNRPTGLTMYSANPFTFALQDYSETQASFHHRAMPLVISAGTAGTQRKRRETSEIPQDQNDAAQSTNDTRRPI
ncbi:hypothetical protein PSTG_10722 [Puccinia striiformis f. sp. tritici PST-78]|uniref:Uncharacterized protein n=1 Tax=Puccinia striiformis f. sp. tritici PST-78 TaxID=1165861 RepID=A0A0L0V9G9_9BASI|nr:hypothetical protein PSTG_10722 [Puccinia striiformis f. sp. tritici PST-78]